MTLTFRRRNSVDSTRSADPGGPSSEMASQITLSEVGIHRDPQPLDPIASATFAQRFTHKVANLLATKKESRRGFLTKTAVVGSALAVGPIDFLLKPGTAYGYLCGTCTDGWTAFCCTINNGNNSCPPGSFVAGWWKADNAAYCCGSARYIIDCNATCPTQCHCGCGGNSCDDRRTCCNQFRYGQCHTEIACYGPVVCRVATCVPPWQYDPSCTTTVRTDNRTTDHGAPCLTTDCGTPIAKKYEALGGAGGILGPITQGEQAVGDGRGRRARYRNGNIYWTAATGAFEVSGGRLNAYSTAGGPTAAIGYPITDTRVSTNGQWSYNNMERGRLYQSRQTGAAFYMVNPIFAKHEATGGIYGPLGTPAGNQRRSGDNRSTYQNFTTGRIYVRAGQPTVALQSPYFEWHEATGGVYGPYGYPSSDLQNVGDGRGKTQRFEKGWMWWSPTTGVNALSGATLLKYVADGATRGNCGYPTSSTKAVGDGVGTMAEFEYASIWYHPSLGVFRVHGAVHDWYRANGGATGPMGYPISDLDPRGTSGGRFQRFQNGRIEYLADGSVVQA